MIIEAAVFMSFIILIEAGLLKLFYKTVGWWVNLLSSVIINLLSVGVVYLCGWILEKVVVPFGFFLPLVLLLITEYILISFMYRRVSSYAKTAGVVLTINITSYLLFFIASMMFSSVAESVYCHREKSISYAEKNSQDLLKDESGAIYTVKQYGRLNVECFLDRYDINNMQWQEVPNSRENDDISFYYQRGWDISKNFIAYPTGSQFSILSKKELREIKQISIEADELNFSPNEEFIAALTYGGDISVERDMSNFRGGVLIRENGVPVETIGRNSVLTIIALDTSQIVQKEKGFIIFNDGVSWSPDGKKLLLTSVKNEAEFTASIKKDNNGSIMLETKIPKYVCEYEIATRTLTPLFEGYCGRYSPDGRQILFIQNDNFMLYSCDSGNIRNLHETYSNRPFAQWSPSGKSIAAFEQPSGISNMFASRIYVMSIEDPNEMLIIGDKQNYYGLRWISE